jgi:hypothetical protein
MIFKRLCFLMLVTGLIALPATAYGKNVHVASTSALHAAVQAHSVSADKARHHLTKLLDHPAVPAQLKARVAVLSDAEILKLERQIMPLEERMKAAGMEEKYLIPLIAGISGGLAFMMFELAY